MNPFTHTTTFYSYKGGVGRTMLLANIGAALARKGRKVLLWDLDVEAPGMHRIPALTPNPIPNKGFLDWLLDWQQRHRMATPLKKHLAAFAKLVHPVPSLDNLAILPAFGDKGDSATLYRKIEWHDFLVNDPARGLTLFRTLLDHLAATGRYDHILLDARTGITDLGGLMAAILPHATVLVGSYGSQNLGGLLTIYKALQPAVDSRLKARDLPALNRLLVVSPVPLDQKERHSARQVVWNREFPDDTENNSFSRIEIPFDSRLLFREDLMVLDDPTCPVAVAYASVADRIDGLGRELVRIEYSRTATESAYPEAMAERVDKSAKGRTFEEHVARLLSLLGYEVEREQLVDGNRVDLIARRKEGLRRECYLVECKDHAQPQGKNVLEKLAVWLEGAQAKAMQAQGLAIARSFSPAALTFANSQPAIQAMTVEDLEKLLFDFGGYLQKLKNAYEQSELGRTYVEQRVFLENEPGNPQGTELLPHAHAWALGNGNRLWLLLGDYGTGKTAFFKRFSYEMAREALKNPEAPVPIAVDLKEFPNAVSLETLLHEHMRKYADWYGNTEILLYLLAAGRVVLLLDAFDEMGTATVGRSIEEQFRQLVRPTGSADTPKANRILVTCRTHFFRDQQFVKDVCQGHNDDLIRADSELGKLARAFQATIDELLLFNNQQIRTFLRNHLSDRQATEAEEFIRTTYDLQSLAPRPVLLEMIVKALPALVKAGSTVTPAGLYHAYTTQWLEDRSGRNLQTTPQQRKTLLQFLAFHLWGEPQHRIHHRDLIRLLEKVPAREMAGLDLDRVDLELRTAAFLTRNYEGYYSFSHKSFREFFFARHLYRALQPGTEAGPHALAAALDTAALTPECIAFLDDLLETGEEMETAKEHIRNVLAAAYRPMVSENGLRLAYGLAQCPVARKQRGQQGKQSLIADEMRPFMPEAAQLQAAQLQEENLSGAWLQGADLTNANLAGSILAAVNASNTVFDNANLANALMLAGRFPRSSLRKAILTNIEAWGADFSGADFSGADLSAAMLADTTCRNSRFRGADCHGCRFAGADLTNVDWQDADLSCATAVNATGNPPVRPFPRHPAILPQLGHGGGVNSAAFSSDNRLVVTASDDQTARLWDVKTGKELSQLEGHSARVNSAAFSSDNTLVVTASGDTTARLWDVKTGGELTRLEGHGASVFSSAFSSDNTLVVTASDDQTARLWDVKTGRELTRLEGHGASVNSAAFSSDNTLVVTASVDRTVRLWEVKTGKELTRLEGHGARVFSAAFSPDNKLVVTASEDNTARLWDVKTGKELTRLEGHSDGVRAAAFSPDNKLVVTASDDQTTRLWDVKTGKELIRLQGHGDWVRAAAFSPDNKLVVTASDDQTTRLWDVKTGKELTRLKGHSARVFSAAFSSDNTLVVTASEDNTARLWDVKTGKELSRFKGHGGSVKAAAFSPDNKLVVTASEDNTARLWDVKTGKELIRLEGHGARVWAAAFSPDNKLVVTASDDQTARLWDVKTGKELTRLKGHVAWVRTAAFSSDNRLVVTASDDKTARLWDVKTGRLVRTLIPLASGWISLSVEGQAICHGEGGEVLTYYDPDEQEMPRTLWCHEDVKDLLDKRCNATTALRGQQIKSQHGRLG